MLMDNSKKDITLTCQVCKKNFLWPADEQRKFDKLVAEGKWKVSTPPTRCPACRCRRIPMRAGAYLNTEAIVEFVEEVETKKGYKRRADLVLRHLFEEIAECSAALWKHEEENEHLWAAGGIAPQPAPTKVARELIDIISLTIWMADILGIDLNEAMRWRMKEVFQQYGIEDRENPTK